MAVCIFTEGKWRTLAGKKIVKDGVFVDLKSDNEIKMGDNWYKLSWNKTNTNIDNIEIPDLPELVGPTVTEDSLIHINTEEPTTGTVWYMTPTGSGNMDGTSWENAYSASNIHVLMLEVSSGDRVYMSEGDYGIPTRAITIPEGISIYGGFIENDYSWETRDSFNHQTVWRGNGEFALFDLTSENTEQVIDGITCENFINEIGESSNCTFRNMVLVGGTFSISSGLTNSKSSNCELTIGGNVDKLYNSCNESKNCNISGSLTNSTISLSIGELSAAGTNNCYISDCSKTILNSLSNSEIVNSEVEVSNEVSNVKCYEGNLIAGSCNTVYCNKNVTSSGNSTDCQVGGNLTSNDGNCNDCIVTGSLICKLDASNCQVGIDLTSNDGNCNDCIVIGSLICKLDASNCQVGIDLTSNEGNCNDCICNGTITALYKCTNCKSNGLICNTSEHCICYENYSVLNGYNDTILNSEINNNGSFFNLTKDDSVQFDHYIYSGHLYYKDHTQIGTESGWTHISGYYNSYTYGIRNGYLYQVDGTEATQVGTESGWTHISGYYTSYTYGIRNGYLYQVYGTEATQVGTESGWTDISGRSSSSSYAYGIRDGYLYALNGTTATQVGTESGWTHISGYSGFPSSSSYAYGIRNGYLYALKGTTATQVGTESGWTDISGRSSSSSYAYGIRNGYLYRLSETTATQVGTESGWTHISGYYTSDYASYAYGIRNGYLYALQDTTYTQVGTESGWTHISGYSSSSGYAYGICNVYLYKLTTTTAKKIAHHQSTTKPYQTNDSSPCSYYILDGYLYYKYNNQVGTESGWTHISGYSESSINYAYGIRNGYLYQVDGTEATQVGSSNGWTAISGYSAFSYYAYGICDGHLYKVDETEATQVGTVRGWTHISGYSGSRSYAYGIRNGYLYQVFGTNATQVGTESGWTHISGYYNLDYVSYAYGIRDGYLYALNGTTATQVGTESGWTHISGYYNSDYASYAYGIRNGYLYRLNKTTATQVGTESGWTHISGYSSSSSYAYGIRNGYLYALQRTTATQVVKENGWTHISGYYTSDTSSYSYSSDFYAYGIRNGYLYALNKTTATPIGLIQYCLYNCTITNCNINYTKLFYTKAINSKLMSNTPISKNSLIVNCEGEAGNSTYSTIGNSTYSTIVNSKLNVNSGEYNVYWNNEGSITPENNAQSEYNESNLLTLEYDNSIARFTSIGYSSSKGIQDLDDCPDPVSDPDGYNSYVSSFGDWVPKSNSFLIGKGIKDEYILVDLNGNTRPDNPTLGAYEPL